MKGKIEKELVKGSKYVIKSLYTREETLETRGVFKGYIVLGRDHGLKMELDDTHDNPGVIRVIPSHMIIHLDVIEQAAKEEEEESKKGSSYFG